VFEPGPSATPNTHILLPSGIIAFGVEDWVTNLAKLAQWTEREGRVERHLKHGLVILGTVIRVRVRRGSVAGGCNMLEPNPIGLQTHARS